MIKVPKGPHTVPGIDVSHYEPVVDYRQVAAMGQKFVFAKASDGLGSNDDTFARHRAGAKAAGLIFGAYHFFRFDHPVQAQIDLFMKATGGVLSGELPLTVDVEWDRFSAHYGENKTMDETALALVSQFIKGIQLASGVMPFIYTNAYFWPETVVHQERFSSYPLWVPAYGGVDVPHVPPPWKNWLFWQYTDHAPIAGAGKIDANLFNGTLADLQVLVKK